MYRPKVQLHGRPWVGKRKRLKKEAKRDPKNWDASGNARRMDWFGGRLYFLDALTPVFPDGVNEVPKPGHAVVGLNGARPEAAVKPLSWSQEAARDRYSERYSGYGVSGGGRRGRGSSDYGYRL